jgi:oxygen-independent coproporphyrinogen-3 oxidase
MNDKTLKLIGRAHTAKDIITAYKMTKDIGISCVNMDLIVGLPGEGIEEVKNTLDIIGELNPENLTVHTLSVKRGSNFKEHINEYDIEEQRIIENMLLETKLFANKMDLEPYYLYRQKNILGNFENIGYAKKGYECIYNISIMEERESIMAAGVGSTSKVYFPEENRLERIFNFRDLYEYINRIDELIERKRKILYSI